MMRWILIGLFLASSLWAHATTYYVSSQGNDRNDGRSPGRAWRSLNKVNAAFGKLKPGDAVLFRRGDRFTGSLVVKKSGTAGRPIRLGAYGSGRRPIIDGFHRPSKWRSIGGNRWKASYNAPQGKVPNLFINLRFQPLGRYPNRNQANSGYLTINGGNKRTRFNSAQLKGGSWRGAEAVIRTRRWLLDRSLITQHSGSSITVRTSTSHNVENGFGFFVVNHLKTLDQEGEWAYHPQSQELFLYTKQNPNQQAVIVARTPVSITIRDQHDIRVDNLDLWGSTMSTIFIRNSKNVVVNNCRIFGSGQDGVTLEYTKNVTLKHNRFFHTANNGVVIKKGATYTEVAYNIFEHTGVMAGMAPSSLHSYNAIRGETSYLNVHHNNIDGVGHNGITFVGDHINVQYNYIRNFCLVKDDGAGIYAGQAASSNTTLIQIKNNIVGKGNPTGINDGTPYRTVAHVNGIYLDQGNNNVTIEDNTTYGCAYYGLFLHNVRNARIARNVAYDNDRAFGLFHSDRGNQAMRGINFQDNELFARQTSQELIQIASAHNDHFRLGTFDRNYYYSPLNKARTIRLSDRNYKPTLYSVAQWQKVSPYDKNTQTNRQQWPTFEVGRYLSGNLLPNPQFTSGLQSWQGYSSQGNGTIRHEKGALDGGSLVTQFSGGSSNSSMTVSPSPGIGAVRKGQRYVLRYTLKGSGDPEPIEAKIATRRGSYKLASNVHYATAKSQRQSVEDFFTISNSLSDASLKFGVEKSKQPLHIDNVELRRVETRQVNYDRYVQFLTNPSRKKKSFSLPAGRWKTLRGQTHQGAVSLAPFRSLILVNDNAGAARRTQEIAAKSGAEDSVATTDDLLRVGAYPNPLYQGEDLTVAVQVPDGPAEVQMYDADGRLLWHDTLVESTELRIPRTSLGTPGVRLVKVTTDTGEASEKVIVH